MNFYHGQPGGTGPTIKVEITTVGSSTPQVLRYRLGCGSKRSVFNASPSSPISVTSIGGQGGHGIPRANGDDTNGGNGGRGDADDECAAGGNGPRRPPTQARRRCMLASVFR